MAAVGDLWFRYDDVVYAARVDEYGKDVGGRLAVELTTHEVTKVTPKGVKVDYWDGGRFICNNWVKKFAYPTEEEARQSFIARKTRQAAIHEARARRAREAISILTLDQPLTDKV